MGNWSIIGNILGGQILIRKGGIAKHWKMILFIFVLSIVYISFHFEVKNTMIEEVRNEEILKDLKNEYLNKMSLELQLSKRGEIEKRLKEFDSKLIPPPVPPTPISKD